MIVTQREGMAGWTDRTRRGRFGQLPRHVAHPVPRRRLRLEAPMRSTGSSSTTTLSPDMPTGTWRAQKDQAPRSSASPDPVRPARPTPLLGWSLPTFGLDVRSGLPEPLTHDDRVPLAICRVGDPPALKPPHVTAQPVQHRRLMLAFYERGGRARQRTTRTEWHGDCSPFDDERWRRTRSTGER